MTLTDTTPAGAGDGRRRALPASVVRITADDGGGTTAGTGFLVAADTVVTCAHVVRAAGGEPGGRVRLVFPHLPGAPRAEGHVLPGTWRAPQAQDIAVLRLESTPAGAEPVALGSAEDGRGHRISSFGFPVQAPEGGHFGYGTAGDLLPAGDAGTLLQLTGANDLTTGFSGGPVLDETTGLVIGMVTAITGPDRHSRGAGIAYATPARQLREVLPELTEQQVCPYRGLEPFTAEHAGWFHGRGAAVEEVLAKLGGQRRAMLLLGPSGAGKSSLVQAGVLPALAEGGLPGSDRWLPVLARPGQDLPAELEHAGLPGAASEGVLSAVESRLAGEPAGRRLLLVVDQFEELLTQPVPDGARDRDGDGDERLAAAERQLVELIRSQAAVSLVLVMRDDFYPRLAARAPDLLRALTPGLLNVPATLSAADLRAIVTAPAEAVGLRLEDGLPERIIADVLAAAPSASLSRQAPVTLLPPLELALSQLWERREDGRLTHRAYGRIGEVDGSLATWCGAALDRLPAEHRPMARRVLTALVRPADDTHAVPATRRHVPLADLRALAAGPQPAPSDGQAADQAFDAVLAALTRHRIVTTRTTPRPDGTPGRATAELVHDALVRDWAELRDWVAQDHDFHAWLHRAEERQARHAASGLPGDLLDGTDLTEGLDWSAKRGLPPHIGGFLATSRQHQQAVIRRTRRINAFLASALVLALLAAGGALWQRQIALTAQKESRSRQLAAEAQTFLETDPDRASSLAVQAYNTSPTHEATDILYTAAARPLRHNLTGHKEGVGSMVFSPKDNGLLAVMDNSKRVHMWDISDKRVNTLYVLDTFLARAGEMEFVSGDGDTLAVVDSGGSVSSWNAETGILKGQKFLGTDFIGMGPMALGSGGSGIAVFGGLDGEIQVWDVGKEKLARPVKADGERVGSVVLSPGGGSLAAVSGFIDEVINVWDPDTGKSLRVISGRDHFGVESMTFSPDSDNILAVGYRSGVVRIWEISTGEQIGELRGRESAVKSVAFSSDGETLAVGGADGAVRLWAVNGGKVRKTFFTGHTGGVGSVLFSPGDDFLVTSGASFDGTVRVWDPATGAARSPFTAEYPAEVKSVVPDADRGDTVAVTSDGEKEVRLWEVGSRKAVRRLTGHPEGTLSGRLDSLAFNSETDAVAVSNGEGAVRLWGAEGEEYDDISIGKHGSWTGPMAFSPDGSVLAIGVDGEKILRWDTGSGEFREPIAIREAGEVDSMVFSPDGRTIATHARHFESYLFPDDRRPDNSVYLWDANSGERIASLDSDLPSGVESVVFGGGDGRSVAVGYGNGTVKLWELGTGEDPDTFAAGIFDAASSVALGPDGSFLAVGYADGVVRLWDVRIARIIDSFVFDGAYRIESLVFGPDGGETLVIGDSDTVQTWKPALLTPEEAEKRICRNLRKDIAPAECRSL